MTFSRPNIAAFLGEAFFRDHARPVEWISILMLFGWLQFLLSAPEVFAGSRYAAFAGLAPGSWAGIIGFTLCIQLVAMRPSKISHHLRFLGMLVAAAIWSIIAWNFWATDAAPISARANTVIALAVSATAVYLGLLGRR